MRVLMSLVLVVGMVSPGAAVSASGGLEVVGYSDLGGAGLNGAVSVVGTTAVVGAGALPSVAARSGTRNPASCSGSVDAASPGVNPRATVKVVDLSDPAAPRVASELPVPSGAAASDVDALRVSTPAFTGDLAAIAMTACGTESLASNRGVEYWDVTDVERPMFLGRYAADVPLACLPNPANPVGAAFCAAAVASSQWSVSLVQRADGRVLSFSTEPGATASGYLSGDLRIVDVTNPRLPLEVSYVDTEGRVPGVFSENGCRPFNLGSAAVGTDDGAFFAGYDAGVQSLDLADPSAPSVRGRFDYLVDPNAEGNAFRAEVVDDAGVVALVEDDYVAPDSQIVVSLDGDTTVYRACEALFTLFDPTGAAPVYAHPGGEITGQAAYVGRGCEGDDLLADPAGKIAIVDRGGPVAQCSFALKARRAQDAGAVAVVVRNVNNLPIFSPDGTPETAQIPLLTVSQSDGEALAAAAEAGATVTLRDVAGDWGGIRLLDVSTGTPVEVGTFAAGPAAQFPPPDVGVYSAADASADGDRLWVAWNSAGVRLVDVADPSAPVELASFVPSDTTDPTGNHPAKASVQGVATLATADGTLGVITDVNSGLYVLRVAA